MNYDRAAFQRRWKPAEGLRLKPYLCPAGYWTVGWGHNSQTGVISQEIAQLILDEDIQNGEFDLIRALPWVDYLDPVRQAAMLELALNMGIGVAPSATGPGKGLLSFHTTLPHILAGRWNAASVGLRASKWYTDVGPIRGERIIRMLVTGQEQ